MINKTIKSSKTNDCCNEIYVGNDLSSNAGNTSNRFSEYFVDIGVKMASNIHDTDTCYFLSNESELEMKFELINENTVSTLIFDLKHKSSCGHDSISNILVKRLSDIISKPLNVIINQTLTTRIFPKKLKLYNESYPFI